MYRSLVDAYAEASRLVAPQGCVGPESPMTDQPQRPVSGSDARTCILLRHGPFVARAALRPGAAQGRCRQEKFDAKKRAV
jgi:hypothetical protein